MGTIKGYRELNADELGSINAVKELETIIAIVHTELSELPGVDKRDLALSRTHFEDACSRAVKAIARPASPGAT